MIAAPIPANEAQRLASLRALDILDSPPEEDLDALVEVASKLCGVPISLLSLIDVERQWFLANVGLPGVSETPRDLAFCTHAILAEDVFEVADATRDERFADNPLVTGQPDIRFYAGAQLSLSDGTRVGTLCVIDRQPRQLSATQRQSLRLLAKVAARALEGRRALLAERHARQEASLAREALQEKNAALLESEQLLESTGEVAGIGGWSVDLASGKIRWTAQTARIHGMPPDYQPQFDQAIQFYVPDARSLIESAVRKAISDGTPWDLELQIVRAGGELVWVRTAGHASFENGRAVQLLGAFQDITTFKQLSQRLSEQHERLRVTLQSIGDAVITTDAHNQIASLNPAAERLTGWLAVEAEGEALNKVFHVVHAESRQPASAVVAHELAGDDPARLPGAALLISRWGEEFGIDESISPIRTVDNEMLGAVIVFRDVSEQRRRSTEIQYRASHDSLTGLVNRSEFESRLERVLEASRSHASEHVLLFIDLDRFKLVNDACGHAAGDLLLQQISKLLARAVRSRDTLARLGGDEFAVLLNHCSLDQAQRIAQQICDAMDDFRFLHDGRRFRLGASIGMVPVDQRWNTIAGAMQAADSACYAAKEAGRNRVHVWVDSSRAVREVAHHKGQWAGRLEHALDTDRFVLMGQRIEPARSSDRSLYLEVLLRMADEHGDLLSPAAFLPAAQRFTCANVSMPGSSSRPSPGCSRCRNWPP